MDRQMLQPRGYMGALYNRTKYITLHSPTATAVNLWHVVTKKLGCEDYTSYTTVILSKTRLLH